MAAKQKKIVNQWKIGDVAHQLDTTTRSLRFYEEEGLIKTSRSNKGTRLYNDEDIKRFDAIISLTRIGISLQEIKRLACVRNKSKTGNESSHKVAAQLSELLENVEQKIHEYVEMKNQIKRAKTIVQKCFGCRKRPTRNACDSCPVGKQLEKAQLLYLIWDQA